MAPPCGTRATRPDSSPFLVRGKAMSTYHSPRGKTGVTGFWSAGDILGAADLGGFDTRQMTVRFLDASTVYTLPLERF